MTCAWAACAATNTRIVDGWPMCPAHEREHNAEPSRECEGCGTPLPLTATSRQLNCSDNCAKRAYEARQRAGIVLVPPHPVRVAGPKPGRKYRPCGTWAAYARHKRYGEQPCEPCIAAMREKSRRNSKRVAA